MHKSEISKHHLDIEAIAIIKKLLAHNYETYLVGGCVRDLFLNKIPKDFDVVTQATPNQIKGLFPNCRIIGKRFRLAHIFFHKKIIEVATFRTQPKEFHPNHQQTLDLFITRDNSFGTIYEDVYRRDFTINGLFYDIEQEKIIDYVKGKSDLLQKKIRTIGNPDIRFCEDPIRILRAIRFASKLNFEIEDNTYKSLIRHRAELKKSDPSRLLEELYRLIGSGFSFEALILLRETEILTLLLPRLAMALNQFPTLLDPYLKSLDYLIELGEKIEITTMLFVFGFFDLQPIISTCLYQKSHINKKLLDRGITSLCAQLPISKNEIKQLRQEMTHLSSLYPCKPIVTQNVSPVSQIQKICLLAPQFSSNKNIVREKADGK